MTTTAGRFNENTMGSDSFEIETAVDRELKPAVGGGQCAEGSELPSHRASPAVCAPPCTIETSSFQFSVADSSLVSLGHPHESAKHRPARDSASSGHAPRAGAPWGTSRGESHRPAGSGRSVECQYRAEVAPRLVEASPTGARYASVG